MYKLTDYVLKVFTSWIIAPISKPENPHRDLFCDNSTAQWKNVCTAAGPRVRCPQRTETVWEGKSEACWLFVYYNELVGPADSVGPRAQKEVSDRWHRANEAGKTKPVLASC